MFTPVASPPQPFDSLLASPDGKQFAVRSTGASGPMARDLYVGTLPGQSLRNMSAPVGLAIANTKWHDPRAIWLLAVDGFRNRIFRMTPGTPPTRLELALSVAAFDVSSDGVVAFVGEDFAHLPEIYIRRKNGGRSATLAYSTGLGRRRSGPNRDLSYANLGRLGY